MSSCPSYVDRGPFPAPIEARPELLNTTLPNKSFPPNKDCLVWVDESVIEKGPPTSVNVVRHRIDPRHTDDQPKVEGLVPIKRPDGKPGLGWKVPKPKTVHEFRYEDATMNKPQDHNQALDMATVHIHAISEPSRQA